MILVPSLHSFSGYAFITFFICYFFNLFVCLMAGKSFDIVSDGIHQSNATVFVAGSSGTRAGTLTLLSQYCYRCFQLVETSIALLLFSLVGHFVSST